MQEDRYHRGAERKPGTMNRMMTDHHSSPYRNTVALQKDKAFATRQLAMLRSKYLRGLEKNLGIKICILSGSPRLDI